MNDSTKYALYFLLGGTIVSLSTYLGAQGRGFLVAFASTFPAITGVTFLLIYLSGGTDPTLVYAKHLLWFVAPWVAYVLFIIVSLPGFGFWTAMGGGLVVYMILVMALRLLFLKT